MKLTFVIELLLVFVLLAFAASAAKIDGRRTARNTTAEAASTAPTDVVTSAAPAADSTASPSSAPASTTVSTVSTVTTAAPAAPAATVSTARPDASAVGRCSCSDRLCNCCRELNFRPLAIRGPGCASIQYLKGDRLALSVSFGDRVLSNTTISGRRPRPVCMGLPGGFTEFCGRVYNVGRRGSDFNACLGLELRSGDEVEASLRVSCFKFGERGLTTAPAQPLPPLNADEDDDDDDDDEDDFGLGDFEDEEEEEDEADADVEYAGFSVFGDDLFGLFGDDPKKPKKKPVAVKESAQPHRTRKPSKKNKKKATSTTAAPQPAVTEAAN